MINYNLLEFKLTQLHTQSSTSTIEYVDKFVDIYRETVVSVANDFVGSTDTPLVFNYVALKSVLLSLVTAKVWQASYGSALVSAWTGTTFNILSPIAGNVKVSSIVTFGGVPFIMDKSKKSNPSEFSKDLTNKIKNHIASIVGVIATINSATGVPIILPMKVN